MNKVPLTLIFLIPGFLLIAAPLISFPYGFYTFLRLTISISAGFIIYLRSKKINKVDTLSIIFAVIVILYNPIIPIHLTREIWMPINFISAIVYFYGFYKIK